MKHTVVPFPTLLLCAALGLFMGYSCSKPTPFGADLLDDEIADYKFSDSLTLQCTLVPEDSLVTSDVSSTADYLLCGQLFDPVFGKSQSDIYTQIRLATLGPNFKNGVVDSIILFLRYDAPGFYGDTTQAQTLRVHRVGANDTLHWSKTYYSNSTLETGEQLGELANFLPKPNTGRTLFDTVSKAPYIRIPLDNAFGQELLNLDSVTLASDTLFWKKVRGLRLSAESQGNPGTIMAFDLNNTAFSRIRLYYKRDTLVRTFDFTFLGSNKFTHFSHDYSGSTVEPYLNKNADDRIFVQGMGGLKLKVEIPYANLLDNIAINKAELELTVETLPGDNPLLRNASQLVFTESIGDTAVTLTSDVLYSLGPTLNSGFGAFGGFPEAETDQGVSVQRYRLTLTQRFQDMVDNTSGNIKNQTVFLNVYPQSRSAMRAIFYGPKSPVFPAKLSLKYTKVR
ncbi:MAG: DUF4270 domain-containing protein [Thermoanaerobaculia bacterium]|nr:DUF4270 domain-containing protein [Thermoanaerobaculia bacterium]